MPISNARLLSTLLGLTALATACGDTHHHIHKAADGSDAPAGTTGPTDDVDDNDGEDDGGTTDTAGTTEPPSDLDSDGYSTDDGDCDDNNPTVFPGATDSAVDGTDQDCDGVDGPDADGDGVAAESAGGTDCDDNDGSVYPGATDHPGDGVDQDCDGVLEGESAEETSILSEIVLDYRAYCLAGIYGITPWDWDGDGYDDLVVSDGQNTRSYILHNAGAWSLGWTSPTYYYGHSSSSSEYSNFGYAYQRGIDHLAGDWDGDGVEELLIAAYRRDAYAWDGALFRRTDGLGTGSDSSSYNMSIAAIDWDGAHPPELLIGGWNSLRLSTYDGTALDTLYSPGLSYPGFAAIEVADFDGDGLEEALVGSSYNGYEGTYISLLDFDGSATPSVSWADTEGNSLVYEFSSGDVDNDGDVDFLSLGRSGAWLYENDGTGQFTLAWLSPEAVDFASGVLADLNGDGLLDILLPSELRRFSVYLNDGAGGFTDVIHDFRGQGRAVAAHDFDGDGTLEVSFVNFEHAGVTATGRDTCTLTTIQFGAE